MSTVSPYPENLIDDIYLPDRTAEVDLITAEDENKKRASLRDISTALGINPHGSFQDVASRFNDIDAQLLAGNNIANFITVGQSGAQFDTITDALDSISDNSINNQYIIVLFPGNYPDCIELRPYIHFFGYQPLGLQKVTSQGTCASIIVDGYEPFNLDAATYNIIENISVRAANAPIFKLSAGTIPVGRIVLNRCHIQQNTAAQTIFPGPSNFTFDVHHSLIEHTASTAHLINSNSSDELLTRFNFYSSHIKGTFNISEIGPGGLDLEFHNSSLLGNIISSGGANTLKANYSTLKSTSDHLIQIGADEQAEIRLLFSTLDNPSDKKSIHKLNGSLNIDLYSIMSVLRTAPDSDITVKLPPILNITGISTGDIYSPV
ncbi:hypothetical protein EH223_12510 [candidate division KSB1 bacterium]|nr:hypothetical protein [candidate division KSB1 bacterium]RQW02450.1 MAG: hypothetical protein EH223_12510 [candidate division KSB1 bacterium]